MINPPLGWLPHAAGSPLLVESIQSTDVARMAALPSERLRPFGTKTIVIVIVILYWVRRLDQLQAWAAGLEVALHTAMISASLLVVLEAITLARRAWAGFSRWFTKRVKLTFRAEASVNLGQG